MQGYAGFFRRFNASIIDVFIIFLCTVIYQFITAMNIPITDLNGTESLLPVNQASCRKIGLLCLFFAGIFPSFFQWQKTGIQIKLQKLWLFEGRLNLQQNSFLFLDFLCFT